jgi:acyl-CoA thioester hydrolase
MEHAPAPSDELMVVFRFAVRVFWEDTDAGGVVFYANYLKFFERARTEWLRSLGYSQERMRTQGEGLFLVAETAVRYLHPARLDDQIEITVALAPPGKTSLTFHQQAWRIESPALSCTARDRPVLLAQGHVRVVYVARDSLKPHRIPERIFKSIVT